MQNCVASLVYTAHDLDLWEHLLSASLHLQSHWSLSWTWVRVRESATSLFSPNFLEQKQLSSVLLICWRDQFCSISCLSETLMLQGQVSIAWCWSASRIFGPQILAVPWYCRHEYCGRASCDSFPSWSLCSSALHYRPHQLQGNLLDSQPHDQ